MFRWLFKSLGINPPGEGRSPHWPAVEKEHLRMEPTCQVCGMRDNLEVHHILPFSWPGGPALELVQANLITLCRPHHFTFGHLCDWKSRNVNVVIDAAAWRKKINERLYP